MPPKPVDGRKPPEVSRDVDSCPSEGASAAGILTLTFGLQTPDNPSLLLIPGALLCTQEPVQHCWVLNPLLVLGFHSQPSGFKENLPTGRGLELHRGFQSGFGRGVG